MSGTVKERVGVIMRVSGACETVHLGYDAKNSNRLLDAVREALGGDIACEITSDGYAYIRLRDAYDEGLEKNLVASYYSGISVFGDCVVLPKIGEKKAGYWSYGDAMREAALFHTLMKKHGGAARNVLREC